MVTGTPLMEKALRDVIAPHIQQNGFAPTYREIADHLGVTTSAAAQLVGRMEARGLLRLRRGHRGLEIVRRETALAT